MTTPRETKAFEILARENARMLMVYLRSLVNDPAAIDDLFQETMVVAWRRLDECDLSRPFGPWLRGIASRLVMAWYRRRKQQPVFLDEATLSLVDRQFESIAARDGDTWEDKLAALHDCLAALPEQHASVVRSRYFDELSIARVAERLGVSLEACKKRLQRARALLAQCLKQKGVLLAAEGGAMSDPRNFESPGFDDRLENWLSGDAEPRQDRPVKADEREQVADALVIHGLLADLARRDETADFDRIARVMKAVDAEATDRVSAPSRGSRWRSAAVVGAIAALAACLLLMVVQHGPTPANAAVASLDKILSAVSAPLDRTYRVHVVDPGPKNEPRPRQEARPDESEELLEGATLYVRGPDRYVFVRKLADGTERTSGYDGRESWSFRGNSAVHLSDSAERFRGRVPGGHQNIPLLDVRTNLEQLRTGYEIRLVTADDPEADGRGWSRLVCTRRSPDVRGPKQLEVWFDAETGCVERMLLEGLPRGKGGPKSLLLELTGQGSLGPNFFSHQAHHAPDRPIDRE